MITTVCFDVHGTTAASLQDRATAVLAGFDEHFDFRRWTILIEATEELVVSDGSIRTWRGEVTARRHDR